MIIKVQTFDSLGDSDIFLVNRAGYNGLMIENPNTGTTYGQVDAISI